MEVRNDKVRQLRNQRGWTQTQLAEIADLSLRTVQRVENQSVASNETVSALCAVLEVSREELLMPVPSEAEMARARQQSGLLVGGALILGSVPGAGFTVLVMNLIAM